jgi:hypothetical protein
VKPGHSRSPTRYSAFALLRASVQRADHKSDARRDGRRRPSSGDGDAAAEKMRQKIMGVASRVADYAQIPALHEGRGMVAGRKINVQIRDQFPEGRLCKVVAPAPAAPPVSRT